MYVISNHTKDHGNHPISRNKCNRQKDNNAIVNSEIGEILMHENENVSAMKEAHEIFESNPDENKLYIIDNMILEKLKKNLNDVSVRLNENLKINMGIKIEIIFCVYIITK